MPELDQNQDDAENLMKDHPKFKTILGGSIGSILAQFWPIVVRLQVIFVGILYE